MLRSQDVNPGCMASMVTTLTTTPYSRQAAQDGVGINVGRIMLDLADYRIK